jgi:hypothetical protein
MNQRNRKMENQGVTMVSEAQVVAVERATASIDPQSWSSYHGGWRGEISTALLDAVYSIRSTYRSDDPRKGVYGRVSTFRQDHEALKDNLPGLLQWGEENIRSVMGNTRTRGRLKSEAVVEAAEALISVGVHTAEEFRAADIKTVKKAYTDVYGLGWITFEYFSMLLGIPGVKADTMIVRFVNAALEATGQPKVQASMARQLVVSAYARSQRSSDAKGSRAESLTHFEHAIWLTESNRAAGVREFNT